MCNALFDVLASVHTMYLISYLASARLNFQLRSVMKLYLIRELLYIVGMGISIIMIVTKFS